MDEIKLKRIADLTDLPIRASDMSADERDYTLYELDEDNRLKCVFLQVNDEARRIYIDHAPENAEAINDLVLDETSQYDALQTHDDENTEYEDYENQQEFFKRYKLYILTIGE